MSDECALFQAALAVINKLKDAVNFRQWTARGKGLVLLNILVRPGLPKAWVAQKIPAALIALTFVQHVSRTHSLPTDWDTTAQVVLCASNWVVVKDCEGSFDPYIFALLRCLPITRSTISPSSMPGSHLLMTLGSRWLCFQSRSSHRIHAYGCACVSAGLQSQLRHFRHF